MYKPRAHADDDSNNASTPARDENDARVASTSPAPHTTLASTIAYPTEHANTHAETHASVIRRERSDVKNASPRSNAVHPTHAHAHARSNARAYASREWKNVRATARTKVSARDATLGMRR